MKEYMILKRKQKFCLKKITKSSTKFRKLLKNIVQKEKQIKIYDNDTKIFTPLIGEKLFKISNHYKNYLQTYCTALWIFEAYCQKTFYPQQQNFDEQDLLKIALVSLQIAMNFHQDSKKRKQICLKQEEKQLKKQILISLDWKINFNDFLVIGGILLEYLSTEMCKEFVKQDLMKKFLLYAEDFVLNYDIFYVSHIQLAEKVLKKTLQFYGFYDKLDLLRRSSVQTVIEQNMNH